MDFATPYSGGLFWDPAAEHYKFFYSCGSPAGLRSGVACLATSLVRCTRLPYVYPAARPHGDGVCGLRMQDGIDWTKRKYDVVPGTNIVYNEHFDGNVVWLDLDDPNPARRFKQAAVLEKNKFQCYTILESPDGVHWNTTNPCTGTMNSKVFAGSPSSIDSLLAVQALSKIAVQYFSIRCEHHDSGCTASSLDHGQTKVGPMGAQDRTVRSCLHHACHLTNSFACINHNHPLCEQGRLRN